MIKKMCVMFLLLWVLGVLGVLVLTGCGNDNDSLADDPSEALGEGLVFTIAELKNYNGQDNKPVYVAINGVVYDVTNVRSWAGGRHQGNEAGNDLTERLTKTSPHGTRMLANLTIVGKIAE